MLDYLLSQYAKLGLALAEHLWMVVVVLSASLAIAVPLTILAMYSRALGTILTHGFSLVYSIPSLAMFALLIPVTGLGKTTAIVVLVLYNQYLLLRNFLTGLREVDPAVVEAATGMGMTRLQTLYKVRLPLALGMLFAGVRLAVVSTIGIATIAAAINAGGLGSVLFDGLRTLNSYKIISGAALSAGLAVGMNWLLERVEKNLHRKINLTRGEHDDQIHRSRLPGPRHGLAARPDPRGVPRPQGQDNGWGSGVDCHLP